MRLHLGVTEVEAWELAERVMSKDQHLTFWLRFNAEFSSTQIAAALGISRQAVDWRLEQGRKKLALAIEALEEAA